jgi:hypothetical protein
MKWLLPLMVLCVALAVLKAVLIALPIALLLVLAYSFVTRPGQTLVFLGVLTLFGLASARPLAFIIALGILGVVAVLAGARRKSGSQLLLTDSREER